MASCLAPSVKNNPLWLQARLPRDVAVEFDVRSEFPEGDISVELFGDGTDPRSGYMLVHGGWNNTLSVIARQDEQRALAGAAPAAGALAAEDWGCPGADLVNTGVFKEDTRMRVEANPSRCRPAAPTTGASSAEARCCAGASTASPSWSSTIRSRSRARARPARPVRLRVADLLRQPARAAAGRLGARCRGAACRLRPPRPRGPSRTTFDERQTLGDDWNVATNPSAREAGERGAGGADGAQPPRVAQASHPHRRHHRVRCLDDDPGGDIKVEAWGDGRSFYAGDLRLQYTASGYVFIFGGWQQHPVRHRPADRAHAGPRRPGRPGRAARQALPLHPHPPGRHHRVAHRRPALPLPPGCPHRSKARGTSTSGSRAGRRRSTSTI